MPLPNFFVLGAARSGTTALYHSLKQHPDVYLSPVKEPYFFAYRDGHPVFAGPPGGPTGPRMVTEPHEYLALFAGVRDEHAVGEATALYLASRAATRSIRRNVPAARLVAVLRDPVDRAYSSYWFLRQVGIERAPTFEEALAREQSRISSGWFPGAFHRENGFYHRQLSNYFSLFPREQIKVYLYEEWRSSPRATLSDLFVFLGVDPAFDPKPADLNGSRAPRAAWAHLPVRRLARAGLSRLTSAPPPPMRLETRHRLLDGYREDIARLEELLGRDLSCWLTDASASGQGASAGLVSRKTSQLGS